MKADPRYHACIIAGGSGERFWPMSRASSPKHLLRLFSDRTLLEETILRLRGVVRDRNVWVLTNKAQVPLIRRALPKFPRDRIIAEPARRDTGPAAALATGLVRARCPDGIVALLPADAMIKDTARFGRQLAQAFRWAGDAGRGRQAAAARPVPGECGSIAGDDSRRGSRPGGDGGQGLLGLGGGVPGEDEVRDQVGDVDPRGAADWLRPVDEPDLLVVADEQVAGVDVAVQQRVPVRCRQPAGFQPGQAG